MNAPAQSWGSQQARLYRRARRDGFCRSYAAEVAGISLREAELHDAEAAAAPDPLPPEAYDLLVDPALEKLTDGPGLQRYAPAAISTPEPVRAGSGQPEENTMARNARKDPDDGEIPKKDFATAIKLLMNDILPAQSKVGEFAQEMATAFKAIKKNCHIQPKAAKLAFQLRGMEDAKRDDFWRSLLPLADALKVGPPPPDLVDAMAPGNGPARAVAKPRPKLVTVPSDGTETDLADAGTGAAAVAAMNKAAAENGAALN